MRMTRAGSRKAPERAGPHKIGNNIIGRPVAEKAAAVKAAAARAVTPRRVRVPIGAAAIRPPVRIGLLITDALMTKDVHRAVAVVLLGMTNVIEEDEQLLSSRAGLA